MVVQLNGFVSGNLTKQEALMRRSVPVLVLTTATCLTARAETVSLGRSPTCAGSKHSEVLLSRLGLFNHNEEG